MIAALNPPGLKRAQTAALVAYGYDGYILFGYTVQAESFAHQNIRQRPHGTYSQGFAAKLLNARDVFLRDHRMLKLVIEEAISAVSAPGRR